MLLHIRDPRCGLDCGCGVTGSFNVGVKPENLRSARPVVSLAGTVLSLWGIKRAWVDGKKLSLETAGGPRRKS